MSEYTQALRQLAGFLEKHPDLEPRNGVTVYWFAQIERDDDPAQAFIDAALQLGDEREDTTTGSWFNSTRRFGPHRLQVTRPVNISAQALAVQHPLESGGARVFDLKGGAA